MRTFLTTIRNLVRLYFLYKYYKRAFYFPVDGKERKTFTRLDTFLLKNKTKNEQNVTSFSENLFSIYIEKLLKEEKGRFITRG